MPSATKTPKVQENNSSQKFYPDYMVILHNDESLNARDAVESLCKFIPKMNQQKASAIVLEAHQSGVGLVWVGPREHAEVYQCFLQSDGLTITIEPAKA